MAIVKATVRNRIAVARLRQGASGPRGAVGELLPEVQEALNAATNPSATNSFQTKTDSMALIIALGG